MKPMDFNFTEIYQALRKARQAKDHREITYLRGIKLEMLKHWKRLKVRREKYAAKKAAK